MEDLIETLTRGHPTEVKVVLASVALALAAYQLVLIAVRYGKLRQGPAAACRAGRCARRSGRARGSAPRRRACSC
jgi:hypothetical protein